MIATAFALVVTTSFSRLVLAAPSCAPVCLDFCDQAYESCLGLPWVAETGLGPCKARDADCRAFCAEHPCSLPELNRSTVTPTPIKGKFPAVKIAERDLKAQPPSCERVCHKNCWEVDESCQATAKDGRCSEAMCEDRRGKCWTWCKEHPCEYFHYDMPEKWRDDVALNDDTHRKTEGLLIPGIVDVKAASIHVDVAAKEARSAAPKVLTAVPCTDCSDVCSKSLPQCLIEFGTNEPFCRDQNQACHKFCAESNTCIKPQTGHNGAIVILPPPVRENRRDLAEADAQPICCKRACEERLKEASITPQNQTEYDQVHGRCVLACDDGDACPKPIVAQTGSLTWTWVPGHSCMVSRTSVEQPEKPENGTITFSRTAGAHADLNIPDTTVEARDIHMPQNVCTNTCSVVVRECNGNPPNGTPNFCSLQYLKCQVYCADHPDIEPVITPGGNELILPDSPGWPNNVPDTTCNNVCLSTTLACSTDPPNDKVNFCSGQFLSPLIFCQDHPDVKPEISESGTEIVRPIPPFWPSSVPDNECNSVCVSTTQACGDHPPNDEVNFCSGQYLDCLMYCHDHPDIKPTVSSSGTEIILPGPKDIEKRQGPRCTQFCNDGCNGTLKQCQKLGDLRCEEEFVACFPYCHSVWCPVLDG